MQVTGYREKPTIPYDVSMGVYVFNRKILQTYEPYAYVDLPTVVQDLITGGDCVKVHLTDNEWLDIGRPADYEIASERFANMKEQFLRSDPTWEPMLIAAQ